MSLFLNKSWEWMTSFSVTNKKRFERSKICLDNRSFSLGSLLFTSDQTPTQLSDPILKRKGETKTDIRRKKPGLRNFGDA
jgi:hypothetical protein